MADVQLTYLQDLPAAASLSDNDLLLVHQSGNEKSLSITALLARVLSRQNPFADIKSDGAAAVTEALSNLGLRTTGQGSDNMLFTGPNGLIIQVFRREISNSATANVIVNNPTTYPTPFPNGVWGVFCTKMTFVQIITSCEAVNSTGFTATTFPILNTGSTISSTAVFVAFGY